jgi:hypothetical protein
MLLTVYLLLARKREKRQVFQSDTSADISQTRGSKLFYGKVSPIVTTTKKRPCHFATYGSGKGRLLLRCAFLHSAHPAFALLCYSRQCFPRSLETEGLSGSAFSRGSGFRIIVPSAAISRPRKRPRTTDAIFREYRPIGQLAMKEPRFNRAPFLTVSSPLSICHRGVIHPRERRYTLKPARCICLSTPMNSKRRLRRAERSDRRNSVFTSSRIFGDCAPPPRPFHRPTCPSFRMQLSIPRYGQTILRNLRDCARARIAHNAVRRIIRAHG